MAGGTLGKGYAADLNNEKDFGVTGMFKKDTKNIPIINGYADPVGIFTNFRARYSEGIFMLQVLVSLNESSFYFRIYWNSKWYSWKRCSAIEQV